MIKPMYEERFHELEEWKLEAVESDRKIWAQHGIPDVYVHVKAVYDRIFPLLELGPIGFAPHAPSVLVSHDTSIIHDMAAWSDYTGHSAKILGPFGMIVAKAQIAHNLEQSVFSSKTYHAPLWESEALARKARHSWWLKCEDSMFALRWSDSVLYLTALALGAPRSAFFDSLIESYLAGWLPVAIEGERLVVVKFTPEQLKKRKQSPPVPAKKGR